MTKLLFSIIAGAFLASAQCFASTENGISPEKKWLHIYAKEGIMNFHAYPHKEVAGFEFTTDSEDNDSLYNEMHIRLADSEQKVTIPLNEIDRFEYAADLPLIDIRLTEYPEREDLWNKELYLDAIVNIDGAGVYEDVKNWETKIKGRGNTTWNMPKKPYRFKASKKISLFGMEKAKSYALIANYLDCSHMRNFVALTLAKKLGMPFSNSHVPVRVRLNGIDKGLYFITEKIGIGGASVDINEDTGWLLELDTAMDEDYCYTSEPYNLPVMVKDPDLSEIYEDPDAQWEVIKQDFNSVLNSLKNCTDESWREVIDAESLINYLMVFNLAYNQELKHPKSVYIYKDNPEDKYHFGPVWDFDWAYTYSIIGEYLNPYNEPLITDWERLTGNKFFYELVCLPGFMDEFRQKWDNMIENIYPELLEEMDEYAKMIRTAAMSDGVLWPEKDSPTIHPLNSFDHETHYQKLKEWIQNRVNTAAAHPNRLLASF